MKITDIRLTLLKVPPEKQKHKRHSVNPIHQFADLRYDVSSGKPRPDAPNVLIAHVDTDEGISGFSYGGYALPGAVPIIEQVLKPVVLGEDGMRTDWLWEKMYSVCIDQAGPGVTSKAISFIDTALWDLKGKMLNQPVYNLLGGKTKDKIRVYASHLYAYATENGDPDLGVLREEAAMYVEQGFTAVKQRFGFGPWDGLEGMKKNHSLVKKLRETIGDDIEQMVDGTRSFEADYAIQMARMVEDYNLSWFEEPVQPQDWEGYVKVREAVSMPISGGENEYSKGAFARWLKMGCADIWQPDVDRCAGVTEVMKIVHMAEANRIPIIPHGGWITNFHIVMSNMACPMAEYFPYMSRNISDNLLIGQPEPVDGYIELTDSPGFGLELNEDAVKRFAWDG